MHTHFSCEILVRTRLADIKKKRKTNLKMNLQTGILCIKCKEVLNGADVIFGTSCGHLYHFHCLRECHSESKKCSSCEAYKPCIFKMFLEFGNVIPPWEEQKKTIQLHIELEKSFNDVALMEKKYRTSEWLVQQLEGKVKKLNDALHAKNITITELENRLEELQLINNFINKEKELLAKNCNNNHKELSTDTTREKNCVKEASADSFIQGILKMAGYNSCDKIRNNANGKENNISKENDNFDLQKSNLTEHLKENHNNSDFSNKKYPANEAEQSSDNEESMGEHSGIEICNFKHSKRFSPEETIIFVARKMLHIELSNDISKVLVVKREFGSVSLFVYFKNDYSKQQFIAQKSQLKKFPMTKCWEVKG